MLLTLFLLELSPFIACLIISVVVVFLILISNTQGWCRFGNDAHTFIHNINNIAAPRIGGTAILIGMMAGAWIAYIIATNTMQSLIATNVILVLVCSLPVFVVGLIEDLTARLSPRKRLLLTLCASIIACFVLETYMHSTGLAWIDNLLIENIWLSLAITVLLITGLTHAFNMIDGLNGLMLFNSITASLALLICSFLMQDTALILLLLLLLSATLGLFVFNFPLGKIFTGDGGAYLLGFLLAIVSLMLTQRNLQVSSWFPVLVMAYPISDLLFSMGRRLLQKQKLSQPDKYHLHSLVFRALSIHFNKHNKKYINNIASLIMWHFPIVTAVLGICLYDNTTMLVVCSCFSVFYYMLLHITIRRYVLRNSTLKIC